MHNRRKFLIQGSMATTAMLTLKPLKTLANNVSRITGYTGNHKLVFIHTAVPVINTHHARLQEFSDIRKHDAIILNAGFTSNSEVNPLSYDYCIDEINNQSSSGGGYKIINKGGIKTGIVCALPGQKDVIEKTNALSAWLKKEKGCTVVVCLSQLGYKNSTGTDDRLLAKNSTHLDIIIGGNTKNFHPQPIVQLNTKNEEVIIHASDDTAGFGKIGIDFNEAGCKKHIYFTKG